jgi:molecular chaperone GrpE
MTTPQNELQSDATAPAGATSLPDASTADAGAISQGDDAATVALKLLEESREKYLRLAAEYDNFRKRSAKERFDSERRGQADVVRGLIEALDDLRRFAHVDPSTVDSKMVVDGALMVERKAMKTLEGHGLELVDPVDQPFNPAHHEAVGTMPAATPEEDHLVAQVYQVGYVFNGQLLRPARVVVKQYTNA